MAVSLFAGFSNVINGQLKGADKQYHGVCPFDEEKLWPAPVATKEDLDEAVAAGNDAFKQWRTTSMKERRASLDQLAEALLAQKSDWVQLISKETGQPHEYAEGEIEAGCEWLTTIFDLPEHVTHDDDDVRVVTKYFPLGLVGGICPWNFPIMLACGKIAGAVSTGNTIIIKPSPYTPYTSLKLAEVAQNFFPPGVIQAIGGDDTLGPLMTLHPGIAKISFTGSTATGKKIMAAAASTLKRVTLELGGNDACIVCPDVDIDVVVPKVIEDAFSHGGQACVAVKRLYVHSSIYSEFTAKLVAGTKQLLPGKGFLSPIQNRMQYDKVKSVFDDCRKQDYAIALGNTCLPEDTSGYQVSPIIVEGPPESSRIVQEEPFGPILPVLVWEDEEDVIRRANDTDQGLGASVWCRDQERAERIALRLEAGSVWVNRGVVPMPTALFGGIKQSGIGGEWGPLGILNYCNAQTFHFSKQT